jgi:hypothetical protein
MEKLTIALLDEIANTIRTAGAMPILYLPVYYELTQSEIDMSDYQRFFFSYCQQWEIQSINLQPFFYEKLQRGVHLETNRHWDPEEHRTAAEGIRAYLFKHGIVQ